MELSHILAKNVQTENNGVSGGWWHFTYSPSLRSAYQELVWLLNCSLSSGNSAVI